MRMASVVALLATLYTQRSEQAHAIGVLYKDPGWLHAFDGDSDYYHDPDGPNPDYLNGNADNNPGGEGDQPALINPGACAPNCNDVAIWQNRGSEWDGSAPGDPLIDDAVFNQLVPPNRPPAPGGVGAFTEGSTTFLRIQDPGLPNPFGWADKGAQLCPTCPKQEGNNRRIEFKHEMDRDAGFSGTPAILDNGVTLSFRARIATRETGPLDDIYPEGGPDVIPWPEDGIGYRIRNNGRGMFMISQNGAVGPSRLAFSLMDMNSITAEGLSLTKTGLVMNNQAAAGGPDTGNGTAATLNLVEIENAELTDWHEFWITVKALPTPVDGNTHEVNVYLDGSLEPETFQVILGLQNESGTGSFLGMGLSSGSSFGAFDVDFIAYKEGVIVPTLEPQGLAGDYNDDGKVDAADYVTWRNGGPLLNETETIGSSTPEDYNAWRANFGASATPANAVAGIPEPASAILLVVGTMFVAVYRRRISQRAA
jgi:hypothetical protein